MTSNTPEKAEAKSSASPEEVVTTTKDEKSVDEHNGIEGEDSADAQVQTDAVEKEVISEKSVEEETGKKDDAPPLPEEALPPLPAEAVPAVPDEDDGWAPVWDQTAQAFYFYNRFTQATQWTNPRVPEVPAAPGVEPAAVAAVINAPPPAVGSPVSRPAGGYDPAIHGDYDPTAWYAQPAEPEEAAAPAADPAAAYQATGAFNRFTGRWQAADLNPENFNDENKSKRQMNAFFDVDAAANSHDGRSLKAERSGKKLSKTELKQFKEKRKAKKEEKRRAWLRD